MPSMMTKKSLLGIGIVVVVLGAVLFQATRQTVVTVGEKPTITIGVIAPLSGDVAFLGEGVRNAAELALADLKTKDTKYQYKLVYEDDEFKPAKTATAVQKLINVDQVSAVISVASAAGNVVNPIAESNKVVHFGIASDPAIAHGDYNFINWTPPKEEVDLFLEEANKRGIKRLAVFGQKISGITAVIQELKTQAVGSSLEIVFEDSSDFGEKDFRTTLLKARATEPDTYLLVMFSPELEILTKQMNEAGITEPITAIESFKLSDRPELFEGRWYVNAADPTTAFSAAYQTAYGHGPTIATPNAYDIIGLLVKAAESYAGT